MDTLREFEAQKIMIQARRTINIDGKAAYSWGYVLFNESCQQQSMQLRRTFKVIRPKLNIHGAMYFGGHMGVSQRFRAFLVLRTTCCVKNILSRDLFWCTQHAARALMFRLKKKQVVPPVRFLLVFQELPNKEEVYHYINSSDIIDKEYLAENYLKKLRKRGQRPSRH
ncbi:hypothetical protein AVEN_100758-1 [Araneus ventricosus]|uniref:Uncharacterized protein n=1 Tax=Araneus ventricosus TaxID=182803 RepID=A0A4Y2U3X8_ARAVE|nr:hypothetical protein AVEN_100758-1 [Araneus ventricosus]